MKLNAEQIKAMLVRVAVSASANTFFEDIEAFRSVMGYFQYKEEFMEGYSDDNTYVTTFTKGITLRITLQGEKVEDKAFINIHRVHQCGYICRTNSEVPKVIRMRILQACRISRKNVLELIAPENPD